MFRDGQRETRFLRNIHSRDTRKFLARALNEMRWRDGERICIIRRDESLRRNKNHNSYYSGVVSRSEWLSEKSQCVQSRLQRSRYTLSTLTENGCLSSVRDLYLLRNKQAAGRSIKSVGCEPRS